MQRTLIRTSWTQKSGHLCPIASFFEYVNFKVWICWSIERHGSLMNLNSYVYHEPTTFLVDHILIYITLEFKFIRLFVAHASRELNKSKLWNQPTQLLGTNDKLGTNVNCKLFINRPCSKFLYHMFLLSTDFLGYYVTTQ